MTCRRISILPVAIYLPGGTLPLTAGRVICMSEVPTRPHSFPQRRQTGIPYTLNWSVYFLLLVLYITFDGLRGA